MTEEKGAGFIYSKGKRYAKAAIKNNPLLHGN